MQEILGLVRRCVEDYDMIQSGDTVAVGVSGGKDSLLTLTALARLSRFYPKPVSYTHLDVYKRQGLLFSWGFAAFSSIFFTMSSGTGIAMMLRPIRTNIWG